MRGFHIDRKNADLQSFANKSKWPFYVDHAASKGFLHLRDNVRKQLSDEQLKNKKDVIIRPNSLVDPQTIETMKRHLADNVSSAKGSSVVGYAFDNEISLGSFCTPVEVDGHLLSIAAFQKWLEKSYRKIETLNTQYGTSCAASWTNIARCAKEERWMTCSASSVICPGGVAERQCADRN